MIIIDLLCSWLSSERIIIVKNDNFEIVLSYMTELKVKAKYVIIR